MPTANQVSVMEVVRPMAEGVVALAMVSAMASMMATSVSAMGAASAAGGIGAFAGWHDPFADLPKGPTERLAAIDKKIKKQTYMVGQLQDALTGHRQHRSKLMKEYRLSVTPPVVEMRRKYPKLYHINKQIHDLEPQLDRLEVARTRWQKERKRVMAMLGISGAAEEQPRRVYPATKKFIEPIRREF